MEAKEIQRYKDKSVPQLLKIATKHFNLFIRNRDSKNGYFKCISCQKVKSVDQMCAGHYLSAGNNSVFRFDELNVNGQCNAYCNMFLSGNLVNYRMGLVNKIGKENVEWLEQNAKKPYRWDRFTLIDIIIKYKSLNKTKF